MAFYIVGVTATGQRLAVACTEGQAAEYIETLPNFERGIYYIDRCGHTDAPVVLAYLSPAQSSAEQEIARLNERIAELTHDGTEG